MHGNAISETRKLSLDKKKEKKKKKKNSNTRSSDSRSDARAICVTVAARDTPGFRSSLCSYVRSLETWNVTKQGLIKGLIIAVGWEESEGERERERGKSRRTTPWQPIPAQLVQLARVRAQPLS